MTRTNKVTFDSEGDTLTGDLFLPDGVGATDPLPGAVVAGTWTSVKELMTDRYAERPAATAARTTSPPSWPTSWASNPTALSLRGSPTSRSWSARSPRISFLEVRKVMRRVKGSPGVTGGAAASAATARAAQDSAAGAPGDGDAMASRPGRTPSHGPVPAEAPGSATDRALDQGPGAAPDARKPQPGATGDRTVPQTKTLWTKRAAAAPT